jgi:hypothetical protein
VRAPTIIPTIIKAPPEASGTLGAVFQSAFYREGFRRQRARTAMDGAQPHRTQPPDMDGRGRRFHRRFACHAPRCSGTGVRRGLDSLYPGRSEGLTSHKLLSVGLALSTCRRAMSTLVYDAAHGSQRQTGYRAHGASTNVDIASLEWRSIKLWPRRLQLVSQANVAFGPTNCRYDCAVARPLYPR